VDGRELFMSREDFPWFTKATVAQICRVQLKGPGTYLHWPDLDVDLAVDSIEHPDRYPLKYRP
jgi:hypothetical protein